MGGLLQEQITIGKMYTAFLRHYTQIVSQCRKLDHDYTLGARKQ